jgi:predicted nucleotidyltransferase component of viral defense system
MFEKTLIPNAKKYLGILGHSGLLNNSYLAGGTGLALQLGHRISEDLDFFTTIDFTPRNFSSDLSKIFTFREDQTSKGTLIGSINGIRFSLFNYDYPLIYRPVEYLSLKIADIRDIAAMKIDTIGSRGLKRDFIDLYYICRAGHELDFLFKIYEKKYRKSRPSITHIKKSLIYFEDADSDQMPRMIKKVKWPDIKNWFQKEIIKLAK